MACLEETLAHFIAALLTYTKAVSDAFLKQLERDYDLICDFFEKHCIKEKVRQTLHINPSVSCCPWNPGTGIAPCPMLAHMPCSSDGIWDVTVTLSLLYMQVTKVCQPLDDLRDVASSDSVDTFVLSYTSLLQVSTHSLLHVLAHTMHCCHDQPPLFLGLPSCIP